MIKTIILANENPVAQLHLMVHILHKSFTYK